MLKPLSKKITGEQDIHAESEYSPRKLITKGKCTFTLAQSGSTNLHDQPWHH